MAVTFYNLTSESGLKKLDDYLLTRSYITGYPASKDDITVYSALSRPSSSQYVNVSRWFKHSDALLRISGACGEGSGVTVEGFAPATEEAVTTPAAADTKASAAEDDDDDVDLFGAETEEENCMQRLEEAVQWKDCFGGASKLVPVGYGAKKMQIMLTIVEDLVSVDDLIESHLTGEPCNEYVQRCDIVAFNFNKI